MTMGLPIGFVAYPSSPPRIGDTIRTAAEGINRAKACYLKVWEELQVGGRFLIDTICQEIDKAVQAEQVATWHYYRRPR